jgi:DNA polymerase
MKLTLDVETFSRVNLKSAGLYAYAEDESTDLLCVCWAVDDGPVHAWIPHADPDFCIGLQGEGLCLGRGEQAPVFLVDYIKSGGIIHAWNASFERRVLNGPAGKRYGFPTISIEQTRCSMARSRASSMPGRLEDAANVLNTPIKKRVAGINAMRYLCKPRADGSRPTIAEERDRFLQLVPYCADDVRAERCVDAVLPEMSPKEIQVYHLDQRINDRGVRVDLAAVADFECLIEEYKAALKAACIKITGVSPSRPGPLSDWIRKNGFPQLENLQADSVRKALLTNPPPDVATVLKIYSTVNMKAVSKFAAMREAVCKDGRIRGMLQYHAAATGRWSSFIVQLHNLFRSVIDDPDMAIVAARQRDLGLIRILHPGIDPMKVFASCIRGMLIADEGKEFVFPDFAGVEARWNAWLFGEEWKIQAYKEGRDMYVETYARAFNVDPKTVTPKQRQVGKILELSMGYQGGVGAFVKMATTSRLDLRDLLQADIPADIRAEAEQNYLVATQQRKGKLDPDIWVVCEALKILWRNAHPKIVAGWRDLEYCAKQAVRNPGEIHGLAKRRIMFKVEGLWLVMRLPSGRKVRYFKPRFDKDDKLIYEGVDTVTRQWGTTSTYGGKICENEDQGGCRDLLVEAMLAFEERNWPIVMHVHDEPVLEAPKGMLPDDVVTSIMCRVPDWAHGFPLAIEGHRGPRYRK